MNKLTLLLIFCASVLQPTYAQFSARVGSQTLDRKYVKSNDLVASNLKVCVLCDDAGMTTNCKSYLVNDSNQRVETSFSATILKSLQAQKTISGIVNIKTEAGADGTDLHYIDQGKMHVYLFPARGSGFNIIESPRYLGIKAMAEQTDPVTNADILKELKCNGCKLDFNGCLLASPGESIDAVNRRVDCAFEKFDCLNKLGCQTTRTILYLPAIVTSKAILQTP